MEMFVSIAQIDFLLNPRLSEEFKWGFFVNWRGGASHNIKDDAAQDIHYSSSKAVVQKKGRNKTIQSITGLEIVTATVPFATFHLLRLEVLV